MSRFHKFLEKRGFHAHAYQPPDDPDFFALAESMWEALEAIHIFGADTLRGPLDRTADTRDWQRNGVREMTRRAGDALRGHRHLARCPTAVAIESRAPFLATACTCPRNQFPTD